MDIYKLYNDLIGLTCKIGNENGYETNIIRREGRDIFKVALIEGLSEYDREIAILEAKVYTYEAIIKNSNFSPMIQTKENIEEV